MWDESPLSIWSALSSAVSRSCESAGRTFLRRPTTACKGECRYDANAAGSYRRPGFSSLSRWRNRVTAMRLAPADVTSQRVLFLGSLLHRSHGCSHCYVPSC